MLPTYAHRASTSTRQAVQSHVAATTSAQAAASTSTARTASRLTAAAVTDAPAAPLAQRAVATRTAPPRGAPASPTGDEAMRQLLQPLPLEQLFYLPPIWQRISSLGLPIGFDVAEVAELHLGESELTRKKSW